MEGQNVSWREKEKKEEVGGIRMDAKNEYAKGEPPHYKSDGVAVWVNKSKTGETYLSIKLAGHMPVVAFKNVPKPKEKPIKEEIVL